MSCNGCRVLRKGCRETCVLRSSLRWIEFPEAQGNATLFLAKFFGRSDLLSLISSVPESQRPGNFYKNTWDFLFTLSNFWFHSLRIFKSVFVFFFGILLALFQSLLFEACGRTVNPVNGAVGLLSSGNWHICQAAVDTVLRGGSLRPVSEISAGVWRPSCDESADRFCGDESYHFPSRYAESNPLMRMMMMENQSASAASDLSLSLTTTKYGNGRRAGRRYEEEKKRAKTMSMYSEESEITASKSNEYEGSQERKILKLFVWVNVRLKEKEKAVFFDKPAIL